jgi:predicted cupin superfamily sugar epimerase
MISANDIIKRFNLKPLPMEGGYYIESYRASELIPADALPDRYKNDKTISTAIYYLLTPDTKSTLHRLPTDEIYHFYLGDPVEMLLLHEDGRGEKIILGPDIEKKDHHVQFVVPRGVWQGSYLIGGGRFALMGTTMSPGFDFEDHISADCEKLIKTYPRYRKLIEKLRR